MSFLNQTSRYWIDIFSTYGWVLLLPVIEQVWYIQKQPLFRRGLISDIVYVYQNLLLQLLFVASTPIIVEAILCNAITFHLFPSDGSGWLQNSLADKSFVLNFLALIFFGEIAFYTVHYCSHKIPFLWEFHRIHHTSVLIDSFATSRFHVLDRIAFTLPNLVCMAYFGVHPDVIMLYFFFRSFWDRYIHSNIDAPRWTHKLLLSSPKFHRWHHATDPEAQNKNFSGDFIFFDLLFGTAYDPDPKTKPQPTEFGEPRYSNNFIVHQFLPFYYLYQRFKHKQLIHFEEPPTNTNQLKV
jgi:sterol desaturase/sphingolipid hydroxylase (fatty acid hydroxylase superfamily)